jgi:hypothetical protein
MIVVLAGGIGRFPVGGHAWVDMQYLLGLQALGHDVYYLEDCGSGSWVYNWSTEEVTTGLEYPTSYVRTCLEPIGFGERWIYRAGEQSVGMDEEHFKAVCSDADLMIVRASPLDLWRQEYLRPRVRAYVDSDPGFTQFALMNGARELRETIDRCERLFTIAQRLGASDCPIPDAGRQWLKTVAPVSLAHWPVSRSGDATYFSTVMQWRSYADVMYDGVSYGNKDREFPKFMRLPEHTAQPMRIALTGALPDDLTRVGWNVVSGWESSFTPSLYQDFVAGSRAEFAVAKHGYVATQGGWFSDRSVCYLACGRPVLVQDTGLRDWLPVGDGILTFDDLRGAVEGIEAINGDYDRHRSAARLVAEEYFAADRVLLHLVQAAMD